MREESRRRYRSSSRDRDRHRREKSHKSHKKSKKSKKSKKYSRRSSSSSSSSSSYESRESQYQNSRRSSESNSRASKTRPPSSENSRAAATVIPVKEIDLTDVQIQSALSTIEEDKFEAKTFFSTRDREAPLKLANEKVIIDLKSETVQLPKPQEQLEMTKEQIFHPNFIGDPAVQMEKWVRKLFNFRQKHFED